MQCLNTNCIELKWISIRSARHSIDSNDEFTKSQFNYIISDLKSIVFDWNSCNTIDIHCLKLLNINDWTICWAIMIVCYLLLKNTGVVLLKNTGVNRTICESICSVGGNMHLNLIGYFLRINQIKLNWSESNLSDCNSLHRFP